MSSDENPDLIDQTQPLELLAGAPTATVRRRRSRAATAGVVLGALGLVAGGIGAGAALEARRNPVTAAGSTTTNTQTLVPGYGEGGAKGAPNFNGRFGVDPRAYDNIGQDRTATTAGTDATAAQSVGLVEITSKLSNGRAAGTGMILTSDGEIVTNHHVVAGATSIKVTVVSTGKTYTARYVGSDSTVDVAVLRLVGASGLATVSTDTHTVGTGSAVTAVGDANGDGGTLTAAPGTVSATDQSINVQNDDGTASRLTGLIELNADMISGDSGGAVLDAAGHAVGMNVAASSGSAQVIGYAIPMATVLGVVHQIDAGQASSEVALGYDGYLGIGLSPTGTSTRVTEVADGGAAAAAGLTVGSTITAIDGTSVSTASALSTAVRARAPGEKITLTWTTAAGAKRSATATLGQAPIA